MAVWVIVPVPLLDTSICTCGPLVIGNLDMLLHLREQKGERYACKLEAE